MIKETTFALVDDTTEEVYIKNLSHSNDMEKSASEVLSVVHPELMAFIKNLKPVPGKSYLLTNAMGASDFFGSNLNADWFSESVLQDYHKTFEVYGHQFRHHVNKDPKIAEGKVVFSFYNKEMHRVELIVEVDNDKVSDILQKLDKKETVATSMACKVTFDICSICGNKAKKREDYCIHLKAFKNKIHTPTSPIPGAKFYGQKSYAINPDPKFFDISFVTIPADSTSSVLTKVANALGKQSDITKIVETPVEVKVLDKQLIRASHGRMSKEVMKELTKYSMPEIMTHMVNMNMMPSFNDFAYMQMLKDGVKEAEYLHDSNITVDFDTITPDETVFYKCSHVIFNERLANLIAPFGEELGIGVPLVLARALTKQASEEHVVNTIPYFAGLGGAYYGYNILLDKAKKNKAVQFAAETKLPPASKAKAATFLMRNPLLFGAGLVGAGVITNEAQNAILSKQASTAEYVKDVKVGPGLGRFLSTVAVVSPLTFLYSALNRKQILDGKPTTVTGDYAAKHPYLTNLGAITATYLPQKIYSQIKEQGSNFAKASSINDYFSYLYQYDKDEFDKIFEENLTIDK